MDIFNTSDFVVLWENATEITQSSHTGCDGLEGGLTAAEGEDSDRVGCELEAVERELINAAVVDGRRQELREGVHKRLGEHAEVETLLRTTNTTATLHDVGATNVRHGEWREENGRGIEVIDLRALDESEIDDEDNIRESDGDFSDICCEVNLLAAVSGGLQDGLLNDVEIDGAVPGDSLDALMHGCFDPVLELIYLSTTWEEDEDGVLGPRDGVQEGNQVLGH